MSAIGPSKALSIKLIASEEISGAILTHNLDRNTNLGIFAKTVSYLSLREFHLLNRVSKTWRDALHTRVCVCHDIEIRGRLDLREFSKIPPLDIGNETFQNQDPTGKVLNAYFFMQLESMSKQEKLNYLQKLTLEQRERIQTLKLDKEVTDNDVVGFLTLCPNVRSLTVISSLITGSFLLEVPDQLTQLKLVGVNLKVRPLESELGRFVELVSLEVNSKSLSSAWLQCLPSSSPLQSLTLTSDELRDDDIGRALSKCKFLIFLKIEAPNIEGSFLQEVGTEIVTLNLKGNGFLSAYLAEPLQKNTLKKLTVHSDKLTTDFLEWVLANRSLEFLVTTKMDLEKETDALLQQIHTRVSLIKFCNLKRHFLQELEKRGIFLNP